jgi:hypothetical protein
MVSSQLQLSCHERDQQAHQVRFGLNKLRKIMSFKSTQHHLTNCGAENLYVVSKGAPKKSPGMRSPEFDVVHRAAACIVEPTRSRCRIHGRLVDLRKILLLLC